MDEWYVAVEASPIKRHEFSAVVESIAVLVRRLFDEFRSCDVEARIVSGPHEDIFIECDESDFERVKQIAEAILNEEKAQG